MKKVIVGLSGGVDSAVAVVLLQKQGYLVEGMFMRNWDSSINNDVLGNPHIEDNICPQEQDYLDALAVANKLNIKLHRVDFVDEYWQHVFTYFLEEYRHMRTPNPDVLCNKEIKFKCFLEKAEELGADYIAMGHYAKIVRDEDVHLHKGMDTNKDQSYFLCLLSKKQLQKALFPLGDITKDEVRKIAHEYNLTSVENKKDSTGVCFIGERNFKKFLQNYLPAMPGDMVTLDKKVVAKHDGLMYYTIGQRKGLNIGGAGDPWFVIGKDLSANQLIVGQGSDQQLLYANRIIVTNVNYLENRNFISKDCYAKFRYRQPDIKVIIRWLDDNTLEVTVPGCVKAATPGQMAVFYDGSLVLGGGTIDKCYYNDDLRPY